MAKSQEQEEENEGNESVQPVKSKTPVIDNFSISFNSIIDEDTEKGLQYFYRENEINIILKSLLKKEKPHIAVIGEHGTGRETLIKTVVNKVMKGDATINLNKLNFIKLDFNSLVAGTKYRGQFEERLKAIVNEIERNENLVFYIEDLNRFVGKNPNEIYPLLRSKVRIITVLTSEEAETFFKADTFLYNTFNIIKINSTNKNETTGVLKKHLERFHRTYSVEITEKFVEEVIEYSNIYLPNEFQPQKSLSIVEDICASIELNRFVNPDDVLHNLKIELDDITNKIEKIKYDKNIVVRAQKYEQATELRNIERGLLAKLDELKIKIENTGKENRVKAKKEDLVNAIHTQTGIDKEKIRKKEKIIIKTKQSIRTEYSGLPQFEILQTQSILHGHQISIKRGLAFVLIPHNKEFDDLFYQYIKPSIEIHELTVLKADNIFRPGNILSQVWAQIRNAEVIVVDVSGQNSNVVFELGLCYGIQRCPILLTRDPAELPFNIRNLRYIQYENSASGAHKLSEDLKTAVGEFLSAVRSDTF